MRRLSAILALVVGMFASANASGQAFFGGGAVAFDPQISTVSSGTVVNATPVVSYDRKYVTLGMQVQQSDLIALRVFETNQVNAARQTGPALGFVGQLNPVPAAAGAAAPSSSPDVIDRRAIATRSVLARQGMFLLKVN